METKKTLIAKAILRKITKTKNKQTKKTELKESGSLTSDYITKLW